ncbi:uncharacterized protein [Montipora capricornis]|uniref:uncharacterized protein n=1 Tax=Montipora capricornis TaxID=246305 RepID=UPI0035F191BF
MFVTSTPSASDDEPSDSEEMDADDDPLYVPDPDDDRDEDEDEDFADDCLYEQPTGNTPAYEQKLFLVAESSLLSLFEFCPVCRTECERRVNSRIGTRITVMQKCLCCSFTRSWDSQPSIGDTPLGNIMMSSGILFGGGSPAKVLKIMGHMNVLTIGYSTFMKHQKNYLHAAVERTYREQQSSLLDSIKAEGKELILGGDGRCDSPGHSAKYGSYSLTDLEQNKILDSQLVQSNEVKNSNAMGKEGLQRSLQFLTDEGLSVDTLITDRHVQIRKQMREKWPAVKHRLDGWHIGKGIGKKIDSLAKNKDCAVVSKWKKSVVNHTFWCAASTDDDDDDLKEAKWLSITNHIMNKHSGHDSPLFPQCLHGRLHGRERKKKWLKPGSQPYEKLTEVLTKGSLLKDIKQMSGAHATSSLEAFHSVQNHFATKRLAFSYHGMTSRLQISILHFNENSDRECAKLQDGTERVNIAFPKYKKGEHTIKKILVQCTYRYVADLKASVARILEGIDTCVLERAAAPQSLSSDFERPDKQAAINAFKSRFKNS